MLQSQSFIRTELPTTVSFPWEIAVAPDHYLWITESGGKVSRVDPITGEKTIIYTASDYFSGSAREIWPYCHKPQIGNGTLGMALDPDFLDPAFAYIYFVYSYNQGSEQIPETHFRIKRLKWDAIANKITEDTNIVNRLSTGYDHLGGRLMAIKQHDQVYIYLSLGDHGISEQNAPDCYVPQSANPNNLAQNPQTQNGKIHRFNRDGSIPNDNPLPGNSFFTRGHRNPQGLMYHPQLNILYDIEHGDRTDDEINVLKKGMNYGWKWVRGYHEDNSYPGESDFVRNYTPHPDLLNDALIEPFYAWCTIPDTSSNYLDWCTVAPSDGIFYGSTAISEWTNSLLVVTLKDGVSTDRELYQFQLNDSGDLVPSIPAKPNPKRFFASDQQLNGRLRDIAVSNDGKTIYLINNGGADRDKISVYTYDSTQTGIGHPDGNINLKLLSNPVNQQVKIEGLPKIQVSDSYQILDMQGRQLLSGILTDNLIPVAELNTGMYILSIQLDRNFYNFKFIKI